jgi:RNA polymerase sigma-70 factor, ECF subfamily
VSVKDSWRSSIREANEAMIFGRDPLANPEPLIRRVYAYCAYRLGDGADAEDATSDTFERALRYRSSFDSRRGTPAAWLIGIARRAVDDLLSRRLTTLEELPEQEALDRDPTLRLDLAQAVAQLDDRDRELVALRYGADMTARQIAQLLGLRTNAVEVALHRALNRLRTELIREEPAEPTRKLRPKLTR